MESCMRTYRRAMGPEGYMRTYRRAMGPEGYHLMSLTSARILPTKHSKSEQGIYNNCKSPVQKKKQNISTFTIHRAALTTNYLKRIGLPMLGHSPFPRVKDKLKGRRFVGDNKLMEAWEEACLELSEEQWLSVEKCNVQTQRYTKKIGPHPGTFYMDHAGAALYSDKQMENVLLDLQRNIYSNPHAHNTSSNNTQDAIDLIRFKVLSFFNTTQEEYSVIFTSGATHALKLVAESFNFNGGTLVYLEDNHTSVLGMRKLVDKFRELKVADAFNLLSSKRRLMKSSSGNGENCLFVYPAESNFAGTKFPLSWIESVKKMYLKDPASKWYTLLDATCFVATNQLDLNQYKPDFVTISFYKIFGYPTGLGALIVKRSSEEVLRKKYLGGGTVLMALSSQNVMIPRPNIHERFEDGTINFLSIISLTHGFETLCRLQLNPNLISRHTFNIAKYIHENLSELRHSNGKSVAVLYGDSKFESIENQGGIINFNLKRPNGDYVGFAEVLHIANLHKIYLRTGCFCNPGACQKFLQLSAEDVKTHYEAGHVCGDQNDLVNGYPTGSVRISFGYMSTYEDADTFISMIHSCFVSKSLFTENISLKSGNVLINQTSTTPYTEITGRLVKVFLYPVKSCAAFEVKNMWKLTKLGLKYDRRWMIVNASGSCVSQKQIKSLCTLKPTLDFTVNKLRLTVKDSEIEVPLEVTEETSNEGYICNSKVCGDRIQGIDCGTKVAEWLSEKFNNPGLRLLRQIEFTHNTSGRSSKEGKKILSLANNAEYLLINLSTVQWLRDRIPREDIIHHSIESILLRFRANFIVDFAKPFVENDLAILCFNDVSFNFSGQCTRCQMICIDQETGEISKEPLQTLSRELEGKMRFGIYLSPRNLDIESVIIECGCSVTGYINDKT